MFSGRLRNSALDYTASGMVGDFLAYKSEDATSFRKPTDTVKSMVYFREKQKCWLCGELFKPCLKVAHNVDESVRMGQV